MSASYRLSGWLSPWRDRPRTRLAHKVLRLSADTATRQTKHRPQPSDYGLPQEILARSESLREGERSAVFMAESGGRLWKLALKSTRDGRELYLTSLHRSNRRQLRKLRRTQDR